MTPASTRSPQAWPLYIATFLSTYIFSIANISAPGIQSTLGLPDSQTALIIGAYSVSFSSGLIICGRLGDTYGRRRLFRIGISAIFVTAVITALAPTGEVLILCRLLQGCAAALTTPQILSSIQATLHGRARTRAISFYSVFAGIGTIGGNILGGAILGLFSTELGWRASLMSIAVIAAIAWVGSAFLTESKSANPEGFDFIGSAFVAATLMCFITGLTNISAVNPIAPLSTPVALFVTLGLLAGSAAGALALWGHLRRRERIRRPAVLPLPVLREPAVAIGMALALLFFVIISSFMFNYAIVTQQGMGISPAAAGLGLTPLGVAFVAVSFFATRLLDRFGPRIMIAGVFVQIAGLGLLAALAFSDAEPFLLYFQPAAFVIGAGQGLMFGPLISVVMNNVPDRVAGLTGGLVATAQQSGMGVGVATLSTLFTVLAFSMDLRDAFAWVATATIAVSLVFAFLVMRLRRTP